jgi:NAD(P)-dependent dehydrogenase (short-subunit alcohol dehydrogenase family)
MRVTCEPRPPADDAHGLASARFVECPGARHEQLAELRDLGIGEAGGHAQLVQDAVDRWGRLDVVINNAGAFAAAPLAEVTVDQLSRLHDVNVVAPTLLTRAAVPHLRDRRGTVINVSSTFGHRPAPGASHYAASKAALESLTRSWAIELAPLGIRVNAVAPGPTETAILAESGLSTDVIEAIKADEERRIPLGRRGAPDDVARWILALADPTADWITGQVIAVDGGFDLVA